jgi:hypothetical protein
MLGIQKLNIGSSEHHHIRLNVQSALMELVGISRLCIKKITNKHRVSSHSTCWIRIEVQKLLYLSFPQSSSLSYVIHMSHQTIQPTLSIIVKRVYPSNKLSLLHPT